MATKAAQQSSKPALRKKRTANEPHHAVTSPVADARSFEVLNIREARKNLSQIVSSVAAESSRGVVIGRRGEPTAAIVSYKMIAELLKPGDKKRKLAVLVVEELLGDAPLHLKMPAVEELSRLPISDLNRLWKIERLPLDEAEFASLQAKLAHPEALARLVRRFSLATAIRKAREAGLYDMAEDATSRLIGGTSGAAV